MTNYYKSWLSNTFLNHTSTLAPIAFLKKLLYVFVLFFLTATSWGQSVSQYAYSVGTETYAQITGANSTAIGDDGTQTDISIGFTFKFGGVDYTKFGISTNGIIRLGTNASTTSFSLAQSNSFSTSNVNIPLVAAFWDDNNLSSGTIRYSLTGTAPNQVMTINWHNTKVGGSGATTDSSVSFLIRLYETTNVVELVYDATISSMNSISASVGLNDLSSFLSLTPGSPFTSSSSTANNSISSSTMTSLGGKKITFTPPTPCSGTPTAGTISTANQYLCSGATAPNLVNTGFSSGVTGITFQWEQSTDNATWANASGGTGATTAIYTPPSFGGTTIYYRCNVTCTNGGGAAVTPSVSINPPANPATQVTTAVASSISYTGFITTWVNGNGNRRVVYVSDTAIIEPSNATGAAAHTANTVYAGSGQQIVFDGTGTSVSVTGLALGTTYYVKVFEYTRCGTTTFDYYYSTISGTNAISVSTTSPTAVPWTEGFATTTLPSEWLNTSSLTIASNVSSLNPALATNYMYDNLYDYGYISNTTANFSTPIFASLPSNYRLVFDYKINNYNLSTAPGSGTGNIVVAISTNNRSSFTTLQSINNNSITGWQNVVIDLSAYSGQNICLKFTANETTNEIDYYVAFDNFKLEAIPSPSITTVASSIACGTTSTITITGTGLSNATSVKIGGTTISPLASNTDTQITAVVSSAISGTVEVTTNGGSITSSGAVSFAISPALTLNSATQTNCAGVANSALTTLTSTVADYDTYTWSPSTNVSGDATNGWTFNPTATTNYTLTATNSAGCSRTTTKAVLVNAVPTSVTVSPGTTVIAPNSITTLTASGGTIASNQNVSNYAFSASTGTYNTIAGTTVSPSTTDDDGAGNLPIGFTFPYNGGTQTVFGISTNGLLLLGNTSTAISGLSSNDIATNANVIAPLWDDNNIVGGSISYLTTGTTPNRVLTVQWTNLHIGGSGSTTYPTISMQVKLFENGDIQFVYGSTSASLSSSTVSIGISGASGNYLSVSPAATISNSSVSNLAENTSVATSPLITGTTLNFTRPIIIGTSVTWSPTTDLYTDASATVAYIGGAATTVYAKPTATTTYSATSTSTTGCTSIGNTTLKIGNTWTGSTSSSWNTASNWSANAVPTSSDDVLIASDGSNAPMLDVDVTIPAGKSIIINGAGTLTIAPGKILTIAGAANFGGRPVIFKSDATGAGMFGSLTGTLTGATNVQVECFIPARRAFRFVSSPVTTTTTIKQNWQENAGTTAGLGTHITGSGGATNGFDATGTNNPSMYTFTNGAWAAVTNTNVNLLTAGTPYRLMVRGDRTTDLTTNTPTPTATTLRATGALKTGNFVPTINQTVDGYSLLGNPYQAPIDIKAILLASTNMNSGVVYYWDPTLNARGGYVTRDLTTDTNDVTSSFNQYVQPGQAVFVKRDNSANAASVTITESHKSVANAAAGVFRSVNTTDYGLLRVNLQVTMNNQWQTIEGAVALFNTNFNSAVTEEDATKMTNLDEEVSFVQNNTALAIACQPNPALTSELPIRLNKTRHTNYQWQFDIVNYSGPTPFLVDTQNNSITQITNTTVVPFTADTNANRFKIVFQNAALNLSDFSTQLALYPNPAKAGESFYIDGISEANVTVFNVLGQNIQAQTKSQGNSVQVTPSASLSKGVYLVNITSEGNTQQVKWIVE